MINSDITFKLQNLKHLLDSKLISESEYNILKEEILFKENDNSEQNKNKSKQNLIHDVELKNFENKSKVNSTGDERKNSYHVNNTKTYDNPYSVYGYIAIVIFFLLSLSFIYNKDDSSDDSQNNTIDNASETTNSSSTSLFVTCSICNNKFSHNGYVEDLYGNWNKCDESHQSQICSPSCGKKHVQNMNKIAEKNGVDLDSKNSSLKDTPINNYGSGQMGDDGRFYENNKCGLCNGTGIEKNRSTLTNEYGRVCPMCDGRGVRSY